MKLIKNILLATAVSGLMAVSANATDMDLVKQGDKIFNTKSLGNCFACHAVNGKNIDGPGSMGPKLTGLAHYPDDYLYDTVYDPYKANPISAMPAFGKNGWLSDAEIKAVVAYLKTIK